MTTPSLRLDKSKPYSTVHGERTPADPSYEVHYQQDGLPFDAEGLLVADDAKEQPWTEQRVEEGTGAVRVITHRPLYTKEMRAKVARKLARLAGAKSDEPSDTSALDDINLEAWLRGEIDYPSHELYAVALKRYGKKYVRQRDLIEDLIYVEKVIPENSVSPERIAILDRAA